MPFYLSRGEIPKTKHTAFYRRAIKEPLGEASGREEHDREDLYREKLYREELFSSQGFAGPYSTRYHLNAPPALASLEALPPAEDWSWPDAPASHLHFFTDRISSEGDFISSRRPVLENNELRISTATPTQPSKFFYRNADAWEYLFVHRGRAIFRSEFGNIPLTPGDQLVIPVSTTWTLDCEKESGLKLLVLESRSALQIPARYRNGEGQLLESAPFSERVLKTPALSEPRDERGEFHLLLLNRGRLHRGLLPHHPFDVAGWDGYLFPFALNVDDFNPVVGRIHLPPPVHQVLETPHLSLCNFVARPFDFHPRAVPVPYYHSNIDCDEVLYYVSGDFMSRRGVREGSITLHPRGLPHGPQPGKVEASLGARSTEELALMFDAFEPLRPTRHIDNALDTHYSRSWLEPGEAGMVNGEW